MEHISSKLQNAFSVSHTQLAIERSQLICKKIEKRNNERANERMKKHKRNNERANERIKKQKRNNERTNVRKRKKKRKEGTWP